MATWLIIGTTQGVVVGEWGAGRWNEHKRGLEQYQITSVIAREGAILAGTTKGIFRSDDLGNSWQPASSGLTDPHVRWLAYHPAISDCEFAGTEPANIFVSRNGGATWRVCPEVAKLRDTYDWSLPYSPAAGCVRGFAFHGTRAYAAVEVGGVLRSDDTGTTWRLVGGNTAGHLGGYTVNPDVHDVAVHPSSPDLVFAITGGGLYRSSDGGVIWECLYRCYCRAAWVDPTDSQHIILGPAASVDRQGRIEETNDGGQTWHPASSGLEVPWRNTMVERFIQTNEHLLAILSNGQLLSTPPATLEWQLIAPATREVVAAAVLNMDTHNV